jgi:acyl transferase domain-containing protein
LDWLLNEILTATELNEIIAFIVSYALAILLDSWGIVYTCLGFSLGEYTGIFSLFCYEFSSLLAACVTGCLSLEDCLNILLIRRKWISQAAQGMMIAVKIEPDVLGMQQE